MSGSADTVRPSTCFVRALVVIAIVGFVLRVAYVVVVLGYLFYWALIPLAIAGALILHRHGVMEPPLLAFFVTVGISVALTYGFTRFRAAAEVTIVPLAAVAIERVLRWITS
jgi:hypothetical protein